jgi:hypothetical protein
MVGHHIKQSRQRNHPHIGPGQPDRMASEPKQKQHGYPCRKYPTSRHGYRSEMMHQDFSRHHIESPSQNHGRHQKIKLGFGQNHHSRLFFRLYKKEETPSSSNQGTVSSQTVSTNPLGHDEKTDAIPIIYGIQP